MKFVKYNGLWRLWDERTQKNFATLYYSGFNRGVDISNLEIVEVEKPQDLNWYGTKLWNSESKMGWLAPNGQFYGCDYTFHSNQAEMVHNSTERELEQKGYIKIHRSYNYLNQQRELTAYFASHITCPTLEQIRYFENEYEEFNKKELVSYFKRIRLDFLHKDEEVNEM